MDRYMVVETRAPGGERIATVVDTQTQMIVQEYLLSVHGPTFKTLAQVEAARLLGELT